MRRPSPLPPSEPRTPERPPAAPPAAPPAENVREPVADVIPLASSSTAERVDAGGPAPAAPDAVADAGQSSPGMRELWRASRAHRRALRAEVRRFTVRQRRRRMLWLSALGAFVLMVVLTVGAAYSPLFAVQRIEVVGTSQLNAEEVRQALDGQRGTPLPLIDDSAVKAALVGFPLVETYTLEARPPHDLVVRIVERTPIGVIESNAGFTLVDAAGVALSTTPEPPEGQALLSVDAGRDSAAFTALGQVLRALPADIRARVTAASATTADDVTLSLGETGTTIVWGGADESADKALVLQTMMRSRPPETVKSYDLSSPEAIVVS